MGATPYDLSFMGVRHIHHFRFSKSQPHKFTVAFFCILTYWFVNAYVDRYAHMYIYVRLYMYSTYINMYTNIYTYMYICGSVWLNGYNVAVIFIRMFDSWTRRGVVLVKKTFHFTRLQP